ncbi:Peroxisomal membrane protein, putative [Pediculus humanus corporis]|uniref:Peroxisomal membrane protein, putative n=1 Tax=Pediculus humanus subsp. corporis TaxID=121224 RepID=E0VEF5_PEDHC|nr:Peroxisomal membrane protein, putative [Pediculus humanus corporis]EEB11761.1 Peroxisomal membrane protein, putative [Pediculus humanus corporis]
MFSATVKVSRFQFKFYLALSAKRFYKGQKFSFCPPEFESKSCKFFKKTVKNIFGKYLFLTNTISSGVLMSLGDLLQQEIEYINDNEHTDSFDWKRNLHMGIIGTVLGPISHYFYLILDKFIPGTDLSSITKKIFLDQSLASPISIVIFFLGLNFLNDEDFETSKSELEKKFLLIYVADCVLWIPFQFFNFCCLASEFRVIYINALTMCYNIFLSFMKYS